MPYLVARLDKNVTVSLPGRDVDVPFSYADGMIGALPVFETREQAEAFSDGEYGVMEIIVFPPNV